MSTPYAVVVGIETYAAGPQWTLNGPHADAARFTRWLRARGVEPARIALFLSDARAPVEDVPAQYADEAAVFSCLTGLQQCAADPFLFFWSGHGMAADDDKRLLFLSDARQGNYVNVDFTNLLGALRTNPYSALARQIFFVDACANYVYNSSLIDALPRRTIPGHTRNPNIGQVVSYAARAGQTARNDRERRAGVFTSAILDCLDELNTVDELFDRLPDATTEVAKQFAASGEAQAPGFLRIIDSHGNKVDSGTPPTSPPAYAPMSAEQRMDMARLLLKSDALSNSQKRQTIIGMMPEDIRLNVVRDSAPLTDVLNLLETCDAYEQGMTTLLDSIRRFTGNGSRPINDATRYYESLRGESI